MKKFNKSFLFTIIVVISVFITLVFLIFKRVNKKRIIEKQREGVVSLIDKYENLPVLNKESLEKRIQEYNSLIKEDKYSEAYEYLSEGFKSESSREKTYEEIKKYTILDEVIIKDGDGYANNITTICNNDDCSDKSILKGYKKWIYINNNWYLTNDGVGCIKDIPNSNPPEFERALSFYEQRINEYLSKHKLEEFDFSYFNCLDIKYSDSIEEEGYFTFNTKESSLDKLQIIVNSSYKEKDDMLTAFLLSHEIYHVFSFIEKVNFGKKIDCIDEEVNAFSNQLFFSQTLKPQEMDILNLRFKEGYSKQSPQLKLMWDLWDMKKNADKTCGNSSDCYDKQLDLSIRNNVKSNPYYMKQCNTY